MPNASLLSQVNAVMDQDEQSPDFKSQKELCEAEPLTYRKSRSWKKLPEIRVNSRLAEGKTDTLTGCCLSN